jgi:hypothetical protein
MLYLISHSLSPLHNKNNENGDLTPAVGYLYSLTLSKKILKCKLRNSWIFGGKLLILRSAPTKFFEKYCRVN